MLMLDACKKDRLSPSEWNPETKRYEDWSRACEIAKLKVSERWYKLYEKLKDKYQQKNGGEKITFDVQVGEIEVFGDNPGQWNFEDLRQVVQNWWSGLNNA